MKKIASIIFFLGFNSLAHAGSTTWMLESSMLAYHVDHPFHNTVGRSTASKGKGVCDTNGCDFLVATPVKSFDSGDANRDLHMLQAVNGGDYPMVSVKTHLAKEPSTPNFTADLTVDFGGKQIVYPAVLFQVTEKTTEHFKAKGQIPLLLGKHNVKKPSLLGVAVKDNVPVDVETSWKKQ